MPRWARQVSSTLPTGPGSLGVTLIALLVCLLGAAEARSQVFPGDPFRIQFQFNISNPGARSLGLGGAFLARADDGTAAYANPAGLRAIRAPEISLEGRRWEYESTYRDVTEGGLAEVAVKSDVSSLSFLAASYPFERWTLALFRHELANFEVSSGPSELFESARMGLEVVGYGVSAGLQLVPHVSVGVSLIQYQSELTGIETWPGGTTAVDGDGDEVAFNFGMLWDINEAFNLGLVFRDGPSFPVTIDRGEAGGVEQRSFRVPNVTGLGMSWRTTHRLTTSIDYYFIQYSQTVEARRVEGGEFGMPDVHELRLGLEYTFWQYNSSPAIRVGVWNDPEHNIRFKPRVDDDLVDEIEKAFPSGEDEIHYSLGFGFVFDRFQLDAAADFSDPVDTYSLLIAVFF